MAVLEVTRASFAPGDLDLPLAGDGEFRLALAADVDTRGGDRAAGDHFDDVLEKSDRVVMDGPETEALGVVSEKAADTFASVLDLFMDAALAPGLGAITYLGGRLVGLGL